MTPKTVENVYGAPWEEFVGVCERARQFSPLVPGASRLEEIAPGSLDGFAMLAPPGTAERRYALALALRALAPGASLVVHALKDKGGSRLAGDLEMLGCTFDETSKRHNRICTVRGPGNAEAIAEAIADGAPRFSGRDRPVVATWLVQLGQDRSRQHAPLEEPAALERSRGRLRLRPRHSRARRAGVAKSRPSRADRHRPARDRHGPPQHRRFSRRISVGGHADDRHDRSRFHRHEPAVPRRRIRGQVARPEIHSARRCCAPQRRNPVAHRQPPPALRGSPQTLVPARHPARPRRKATRSTRW